MKLAYIEKSDVKRGSGYKYIEMFRKVAQVIDMPLETPSFKDFDGILVRGDGSDAYKIAIQHNLPYILIENDVASMRTGTKTRNEREMLERATSVLFPCDSFFDYCRANYKIKYATIVVLKPLQKDIIFDSLPKLGSKHCVYAGNYLGRTYANSPYAYRYNLPIFKKVIAAGYIVHLYPSVPRIKSNAEYRMIGCIAHEGVENRDLYKELSQYSFGLQVFNNPIHVHANAYGQCAIPNKAWEYLGAGIPTLGINGGLAPKYYEGIWGTNLTLDQTSPIEIQTAVNQIMEFDITDTLRNSRIMDNEIEHFRFLVSKIAR